MYNEKSKIFEKTEDANHVTSVLGSNRELKNDVHYRTNMPIFKKLKDKKYLRNNRIP